MLQRLLLLALVGCAPLSEQDYEDSLINAQCGFFATCVGAAQTDIDACPGWMAGSSSGCNTFDVDLARDEMAYFSRLSDSVDAGDCVSGSELVREIALLPSPYSDCPPSPPIAVGRLVR